MLTLFLKKIILLFCLASFTLCAFALSEDSKKKLFIVADSTLYNYKTGVTIFTGHVVATQGTTHITADKLITKSNRLHRLEEAIAYGVFLPAHYWTLPKLGEAEMHAYANVIKFRPLDELVTLQDKVTVRQGENSFQGQLIHYNNVLQTITVPATNKGRATLVYNPEKA